jgi:hypothetical protein
VCVCLYLVPVPMRSQAWAKARGRMITSGQPRPGDTDKRKQPVNPKSVMIGIQPNVASCGKGSAPTVDKELHSGWQGRFGGGMEG